MSISRLRMLAALLALLVSAACIVAGAGTGNARPSRPLPSAASPF